MDDPPLPGSARDHGYATHRRPLAVLHAQTLDDVHTIAYFTTKHSPPDGQPQAFKGTVLEIRSLSPITGTGDYLAPVDAGTRWSDVLSPPPTQCPPTTDKADKSTP